MENLKSYLHITYPRLKDDGTQILDESRSKDPVVMIFGWVGANDRYLKVYSQIYEEKGFPTVRLTVSPLIVLFNNKGMTKYCDRLLTLLDEPDFKDRPVIFHLFSNGGTFQYDILSVALQKEQAKSKLVKGVIFDSGPAPRTLYNSFTVISMIIRSSMKTRLLIYPLTLLTMACLVFFVAVEKIGEVLFGSHVFLLNPYNNLMHQENLCPQLFFYSKADPLVPYRKLEAFIETRRMNGVDVTTKLYETTPHVKHYPSDKLGYCKTVFKFLNKVLKK